MKTLFLIGGTMGVGKTTVGLELKNQLPGSVFLDGDTCWTYQKGPVTEKAKKEVMEKIIVRLNKYLKEDYENIVFTWVMHLQSIIDEIVSNLSLENCKVICVSLMCSKEVLLQRLNKDIADGLREEDVIQRSLKRISFYDEVNSIKIDTDSKSPKDIAKEIISFCKSGSE